MKRPTISIVMPNYNHATEMRVSLATIVNQSRPADEIIVVDDGSTDTSREVIAEFAAGCPALRLVRHGTRQGVAAAVNRGLAETTTSHIILASADERIMPDMCEQMEMALNDFPDAALVIAQFTEWFPETGLLRYGDDNECKLWFVDGARPVWVSARQFQCLLHRRHVRLAANSAMFARAALFEVGLFDPALQWHADWFAIYAIALRYGFVAVPRVLSWYRVAPGSFSARGASTLGRQGPVVMALHTKLDDYNYADIRRALLRSPSAMAPFMRATLLTLVWQPRRYGRLARIGLWWLREVLLGRRPKRWATILRHVRDRIPRAGWAGSKTSPFTVRSDRSNDPKW